MQSLVSGNDTLLQAGILTLIGKVLYDVISHEFRRKESSPNTKIYDALDDLKAEVNKMRTALTGLRGDNGVLGEIRGLRERMHGVEGDIHFSVGRLDVFQQRLGENEKRISENEKHIAQRRVGG